MFGNIVTIWNNYVSSDKKENGCEVSVYPSGSCIAELNVTSYKHTGLQVNLFSTICVVRCCHK